ncbi:MAG: hypothetical protein ACR2NL_02895 [Acidimicrobiia bacterium]
MTLEEGWVPDDADFEAESERIEPSPLRRWVLSAVAALVAAALALVPIYNLIGGADPEVADNGLEVCGFDYCVVQEAVRAAGLDFAMVRLANTYLDDSQAEALAGALLSELGEREVSFEVVDSLERRIAGQYSPETRTIVVERPVRAWIVVHEVAHVVSSGHGPGFQATLIDLTRLLEAETG